jgi:hypothetical protein
MNARISCNASATGLMRRELENMVVLIEAREHDETSSPHALLRHCPWTSGAGTSTRIETGPPLRSSPEASGSIVNSCQWSRQRPETEQVGDGSLVGTSPKPHGTVDSADLPLVAIPYARLLCGSDELCPRRAISCMAQVLERFTAVAVALQFLLGQNHPVSRAGPSERQGGMRSRRGC